MNIVSFNNIKLKIEQYATGPGPAFDHFMEEIDEIDNYSCAYDPDTLSK